MPQIIGYCQRIITIFQRYDCIGMSEVMHPACLNTNLRRKYLEVPPQRCRVNRTAIRHCKHQSGSSFVIGFPRFPFSPHCALLFCLPVVLLSEDVDNKRSWLNQSGFAVFQWRECQSAIPIGTLLKLPVNFDCAFFPVNTVPRQSANLPNTETAERKYFPYRTEQVFFCCCEEIPNLVIHQRSKLWLYDLW